MSKREPETLKIWIKKAENDLKTAIDELSTQNPATDTVCFHAQQCAEKYLKAFLVANRREIKKTHLLEELIDGIAREIDPEFKKLMEETDILVLSNYAVFARYPPSDSLEEAFPSLEEARKAVESAKKLREFIRKKLKELGFIP